MKKKIAVVVQRFGKGVLGGSEDHCRKFVELFKKDYDITVLTTTADDYITWKNVFPSGQENADGYNILRFYVASERDITKFNRYSEIFFTRLHEGEPVDEDDWFHLQGPHSPGLIEYIMRHHNQYDLFVFYTYLYYPTVYGLPEVADKSILIPTAHDEPPFYLNRVKTIIEKTSYLIFNTKAEKEFTYSALPGAQKRNSVGACYVDRPEKLQIPKRPIKEKYILYFGRLERGKGVFDLLDNFMLLNSYHPELRLICLGKKNHEIHPRHGVIFPGFVSEEEKWAYIRSCEFVVLPSPYESLSITLLEGFSQGKCGLVNGKCKVLKDHIIKGNAGLVYENTDEFVESAKVLLENASLKSQLEKNARSYVDKFYSRDAMKEIYGSAIKTVLS